MDIWRDSKNRLLLRFWSRSHEVGAESWELVGVPDAHLLDGQNFDDSWVPDGLRDQYDTWVRENC